MPCGCKSPTNFCHNLVLRPNAGKKLMPLAGRMYCKGATERERRRERKGGERTNKTNDNSKSISYISIQYTIITLLLLLFCRWHVFSWLNWKMLFKVSRIYTALFPNFVTSPIAQMTCTCSFITPIIFAHNAILMKWFPLLQCIELTTSSTAASTPLLSFSCSLSDKSAI
jgi:hypothetical protein